MHTDKYGRTWRYTPHHDMANALQISCDVVEFVVNAERAFAGEHADFVASRIRDYFLLKDGGLWQLCARSGAAPDDFYSLMLDPRIAALAIEMHGKTIRDDVLEAEAYENLVPGASQLTVADYEEVIADHRALVREIDVIINGEAGAAKQASLCDLVGRIKQLVRNAQNWQVMGREWLEKTEWVQEQQDSFPFRTLGIHRADVMKAEIERLRALVAQLRRGAL